jgi:hypothetical protein
MLTIERPSPISNKLVIAAIVFGVGFIGSLSTLRILQPGLGQLSSGHQTTTVFRSDASSSDQTQPSGGHTGGSTKQGTDSTKGASSVSGEVMPVTSDPVDPPTSSYTAQPAGSTPTQPSGSGTFQISGQVAPTGKSSPSVPASTSASTITQPSTNSLSSPTAPITSLTQPLTDTTQTLLPSL